MTTYKQRIANLVKIPTSEAFLLSKIHTNIVSYSDLKYIKTINELFTNDSFILLYENTSGRIGHWCCVLRRDDLLSYFDSYGRQPDPKSYIKNQYPHLSRLLYESTYRLEYNEHNFQTKKGAATCGPHCIVRILFKDRPLEEYHSFMKSFKNTDELVAAITDMI